MLRSAIIALSLLISAPAMAENQGFFACLLLTPDQAAWFGQAGIKSCCDLADGMPTRYEERPDGTYVPPFSQAVSEAKRCQDGASWNDKRSDEPDHSHWVRVPDGALKYKSNPIGFAVIWWTNTQYWMDGAVLHDIRCFVGTPRV